jgi:hypothetical protein
MKTNGIELDGKTNRSFPSWRVLPVLPYLINSISR